MLEDVSKAAREQWLTLSRKTLAELPRQIDYSKLSRPAQVDFEILKHSLETSIWVTENIHPFEEDPRVYNSYISDSTFLLLALSGRPLRPNTIGSGFWACEASEGHL